MFDVFKRVIAISKREVAYFGRRPLYLFGMLIMPVAFMLYFTVLMGNGLPTKLPCGLVDEDNSTTSRSIIRILGAMSETDLKYRYSNFHDARKAMQRGEIYAFFYVPKDFSAKALASRQPKISFYTNDSYFIAGSLLMKDLKVASELAGLAITRATLSAKGISPEYIMGILQPIAIETHPINNPTLNYSVYLNNTIVPGILFIMVMLFTAYTIGLEWKLNTQKEWYNMAGGSVTVALAGKLLPQFALFSVIILLIDVVFYRIIGFPCHVGIIRMMLIGLLCVVASQAIGITFFGLFCQMRLSMSACSLLGVAQISLSGFSFPVPAMHKVLQTISWALPLRHYYLMYVNQALNGYPIVHVWPSIVALLTICLLPFAVLGRISNAFVNKTYKP